MEMRDVRLVIFDLDGVIIDSEWAHEKAKTAICVETGMPVPSDLAAYTGRSNRVFWADVLQSGSRQGDVDELVRRQFALVMAYLDEEGQGESPGLTHLLQCLHANNVKTAVSSGSEAYFIRDILRHLQVEYYFDFVVSGNDLKRLKPYPDIYLLALEKSGIPAASAIAVEDSASGCQAAQSAGMRCVGYTALGKNPQNLGKADARIGRLEELEGLLFPAGQKGATHAHHSN